MQSNRQIQSSNFFKRTTRVASLCLLFICFSATTLASEEMHVIQLSGTGELTLVPDTASITLGVNVRGDDLSALQTATDSAVSNILARLRALGIRRQESCGNLYPHFTPLPLRQSTAAVCRQWL